MLTEADIRRLQGELDYYENAARHYRMQARKATPWFKRIINGDAFFIVTGALMAGDIGLLLWMAQR